MTRWVRRKQPTRAELIDRKHSLNGEIASLAAELRQREARGASTSRLRGELDRLRDLQYRTRHEIDRAEPPR